MENYDVLDQLPKASMDANESPFESLDARCVIARVVPDPVVTMGEGHG